MYVCACVCVCMCVMYYLFGCCSEAIDLDPYGGSTDEEGNSPKISPRVSSIESDGGDTEDEIRRYKSPFMKLISVFVCMCMSLCMCLPMYVFMCVALLM